MKGSLECTASTSNLSQPLHPIHPPRLIRTRKHPLYPGDENAEGLVSDAGRHEDHPGVRTSFAGPFPQERLEVPDVRGHENTTLANGQLQHLRVRDPL